jgi:hypothetical protein
LDDFLVVAFFFLAAMARVTSFQERNVKLDNLSVNDFLLSHGIFSGRVLCSREKKLNHEVTKSTKTFLHFDDRSTLRAVH